MIKDDGYYAIRNDGFGPGLGQHGFMLAKAGYVYVSDGKKIPTEPLLPGRRV